jgi:hypothetical protein
MNNKSLFDQKLGLTNTFKNTHLFGKSWTSCYAAMKKHEGQWASQERPLVVSTVIAIDNQTLNVFGNNLLF